MSFENKVLLIVGLFAGGLFTLAWNEARGAELKVSVRVADRAEVITPRVLTDTNTHSIVSSAPMRIGERIVERESGQLVKLVTVSW